MSKELEEQVVELLGLTKTMNVLEAIEYVKALQYRNTDYEKGNSNKLLRELRNMYLVNIDMEGNPKANIVEIMNLWDRVNRELQIITID